MIRKILIGFGIATVVILILLWLITGGVRRTIDWVKTIGNPIAYVFGAATSTGGAFRLPWQPDLGIGDLYEIPDSDTEESSDEPAHTPPKDTGSGNPSPYRGAVHLDAANAEMGFSKEFVQIEADSGNTAPIDVTSWSLQSALTGVRAYIPRGAGVFTLGAVNEQDDIYLSPGATALLATPQSPVGTSFRENICSGYLGRMQIFTPSLASNCPPPSESLPLTAENLRAYGDACFDFVQTLPACTFPQQVPPDVSPACHIFLSNTLSYNGCVQTYQTRSDFSRDSWRIYLNAGAELWRNTHDVIRLLDREGKTVDVITY